MKTRGRWRQYLRELVDAGQDPAICAARWADDARCVQRSARLRRANAFTAFGMPLCRGWSDSRRWG
jgi:hypothetical protein